MLNYGLLTHAFFLKYCFVEDVYVRAGLYKGDNVLFEWDTLELDLCKDYTKASYKTEKQSAYNVLKGIVTSLDKLTLLLPRGIRQIGAYALAGCNFLERIIVSEGVEKINNQAFFSCCNLKFVCLPESLRFMGNSIFDECYSLDTVYISGKECLDCDKYDIEQICYYSNGIGVIVVDNSNRLKHHVKKTFYCILNY